MPLRDTGYAVGAKGLSAMSHQPSGTIEYLTDAHYDCSYSNAASLNLVRFVETSALPQRA